jgi:protein-S-isoprenylcysteine O-methyltransferase Ste14
MFLLAGIGILRIMWLPFWDSYPPLLSLGDIAYLPYWIVTYPIAALLGTQTGLVISSYLAYLVLGAGLIVFFMGTLTWFYGKLEGKKIFDFWIYKYSRHPQYLGFIMWSYGVMLLTTLEPAHFIRQPEPSLPWLISALLVICLALAEEIEMFKRADRRYREYRKRTPFMLPLPRFVSKICTAPNRAVIKKDFPESAREVLYTFVVSFATLVLLSTLIVASAPSGVIAPI